MSKTNTAPSAKGWGKSSVSRKWHYFNNETFSLCRKIGFYYGKVEDTMHGDVNNCAECKKRLKSLLKKPSPDSSAAQSD